MPAGSTTAIIDVTGINDDTLVEGSETIVVQITGTNNSAVTINAAADTATISITDNDSSVASITATTNASETGPTNGRFTVSLTNAVSTAVTLNYSVLASSTATAGGTDYTTLSGSVSVPANNTSATIDVTGIVDDSLVEGSETVVVQITSTSNAAVTIGATDTATVNITDNDTSQASVSTTTNASETGPTSGRFTVNFTAAIASPVTVNYSVLASSTATAGGVDYTSLSGSVVVAAGSTSAPIDVTGIVDDALIEGNETVVIQLTGTSSALVSINAAADTATVTITDNDVSGPGVTDASRSTATVSPAYVTADGTTTATITITLRDNLGNPVSGSNVTVSSSRGGSDTIVQPAAPTDANGQTTATISSATVGLSDLTITDTTFGIILSNKPTVAFNQGQVLTLTKTAAKSEAEIGEIIPYTVVIRNNTATAVTGVNLNESIPRGFKYVSGSSTLNGAAVADPSGSRILIYSIGTVPALVDTNANGIADPGETGYMSLTYYVRVGSGVTPSQYVSSSTAVDICTICSVSNTADVMVSVSLDPVFDLGTIIGKVYNDRNHNGELDAGEPGVAGAMVVLDDGTYAVTDKFGRYHIPAIKPGQRLLKINLQALPGSSASSSETKIVDVTQGLLVKANFGVHYQGAEDSIGEEGRIGLRVDTDIKPTPVYLLGSTRTFSVLVNGRKAHLPVSEVEMNVQSLDQAVQIKGGQLESPVRFQFEVSQPELTRQWRLVVRNAAGKTMRTLTGRGAPPRQISWDGLQDNGRLITGGQIYSYEMEATFRDGSIATSSRRLFGVDVTSAISLELTGGAFESGSARLSKYARRILKETAVTLRKYPNEKIVLEGHSDSRGAASTNLKLSGQRAQAARDYLVKVEKISPSRFVVKSFGESKPIASNRTAEGRALNRRVDVRGEASRTQKANLFDQFYRASKVTMNGQQVRIDQLGRFAEYMEPDEQNALNFEVINDHGRSLRTRIQLPTLQLDSPKEPLRVSYGEITDRYQVQEAPKSFLRRRRGTVMTYILVGRTDPGNVLLLDGKRQVLAADGSFSLPLELKTGYNSYGLMVTNSNGYTRTANVILQVSARDRSGNALLAFEPVPNLKVKLPPHLRALKSESLSFWGQTDAGNKVTVNGLPVKVQNDGQFNASVTLPKGKSQLVIEATDRKGYKGRIEREVNVGGTELFFLAFADGKFGQVSSKVQGGGSGDGDSYYAEGRLAFYAKGVIKGKYLLTASVDSTREDSSSLFKGMTAAENKQLLSNIDPDKLYPVYGDSSTLTQDAAGQGPVYLALTSDDLDVVIGNYAVKLEGNEVANYQRNLYGARGIYRSLAKSKFGQPNTTVVLFAAEVQQIHVTDEVRGTGGSLYYLSHRDVIEGSEQVSMIVRDQNTGLTLSKRALARGTDYNIRYSEGRLLFTWPISSTQAGDTLIGDQPLSGNPVYLMVDYESKTSSMEQTAAGGHVRKQLGDHVAVGATYVQDAALGGNYKLSGVDAELRLSQKTRVVVESAQSQGSGGRKFVSEDGGVTYKETTAVSTVSGQAWKVAAEVDISSLSKSLKQGTAAVYVKRVEPGFETNQSTSEQGSQKVGVNADMQIGEKDQVRVRVDQEQLDSPTATGAATHDTAAMQWMHRWGVWDLATEYRYRRAQDTNGNLLEHSSTAAALAKWKISEKFNLQFAHQQTLEGAENNLSTVGGEYKLLPNLALTGAFSSGTRGDSAEGGLVMKFGDSRMYIKERETHDANGSNNTSILGAETGIGDNSKLYSEYQWQRGDSGVTQTSLLGARKQWGKEKGWKFLVSGEYADVYGSTTLTKRYAGAFGASYDEDKRWKLSTRNEYRREFGTTNRYQVLTTNNIEYKLNTDFSVLGKYNYSVTRNSDTAVTEGELNEQSIGLAYRPVKTDRFNALGRYTRIGDTRPLAAGDTSQLSSSTDIFSVEWSYDFRRNLEWVEKLAYKDKSVIDPIASYDSHTILMLHRLNYRFRPKWDVGFEYRTLSNREANDQKAGWLTELSWEMEKHLRLGFGYNFTDFSDNEYSDNNFSEYGWFVRVQGKY
ncbi:MAG: OmpA family protein [Acidiferrobacterales bacterium]